MAIPFTPSPITLFSRSPSPQEPEPEPASNVNPEPASVPPTQPLQAPTSDAWKQATCANEGVVDASLDPRKRWSLVDAKDALVAANNDWTLSVTQPDHIPLEYAAHVSNFFNGPELWACKDIGNVPCSTVTQCDETNAPAGYMILNSFSQLHQIHQEIFNALDSARNNMQDSIGAFTPTFTTKFKDDTAWIRTLLDLIGFSVGLGSAFVWNRVATQVLAKTFTAEQRGQYKDNFNVAIAFQINAVKNYVPKAKSDLEKQSSLSAAMGTYFNAWRDSIKDYITDIFSGNTEALEHLSTLLGDGGFNYRADGPNLPEWQAKAEAIVYSQLISTAWRTNPAERLYPVIIEVPNVACPDAPKVPSVIGIAMDDSTAQQTNVCYKGNVYYLVRAVYRDQPKCARECVGGDPFAGKLFQPLPGGTIDNFKDGTPWSGIKLDDFVISSVDAWETAGRGKGYPATDPEAYSAQITDIDNNDLGAEFGKVLQLPGIYQIPICSSDDLSDVTARIGGMQGKPPSAEANPWWPCNA